MSDNNHSRVSIIILNWNGLKDTIECLESLKKITYPNYEVILVDNGSDRNEANILEEKYKNYIRLIRNKENLGFAKGNNVAIRQILQEGKSAYALFLNNDTVVEPDFLEKMIEKAEQNEKIGMTAARIMQYKNRSEIDNLGLYLTRSGLILSVKDKKTTFFPSGTCSLYKAKALEAVEMDGDFFDSDFFCYAEDFDLAFRVLFKGYIPARADNAVIYHKGTASTGGVMSDFAVYHSQRNNFWVLIKNLPTYFWLKYLFWMLLFQFGIILLYIKRRKLGLILKADFDAFKSFKKFFKKRKVIQRGKKISNRKLKKYIGQKIILSCYLKNIWKPI